jgi:3-dehydroquinate synthetase
MKSPPEIFAKLNVDLGERSYPIVIGKHLLEQTAFADYIPGSRVVIVTNTIVAPLYLERLTSMLTAAGKHCLSIVLPDGEEEKNIEIFAQNEDLNRKIKGVHGSPAQRAKKLAKITAVIS